MMCAGHDIRTRALIVMPVSFWTRGGDGLKCRPKVSPRAEARGEREREGEENQKEIGKRGEACGGSGKELVSWHEMHAYPGAVGSVNYSGAMRYALFVSIDERLQRLHLQPPSRPGHVDTHVVHAYG